jgi:YfiH family protein
MLQPITATCLSGLPGIAHGFFTRKGGVSSGIYAALNCGAGSDDDKIAVNENRARAARYLGVPTEQILTCHQLHSATAVIAHGAWNFDSSPKADAIVTATAQLAIGVLAADCAPVLMTDPTARVVGAVHAGWRGALSGVLEGAIQAMESLGAKRSRIRAALGPCIGPRAYEVGPEFESQFLQADAGNVRFFKRLSPNARARFNLPDYVLTRLNTAGLRQVESATCCTYENESLFYSYRRSIQRQEPDYGRQISAILLT